jgi:hypothetical protein
MHHPGGIAPMSLTTYENTRPWAKAIKAKVVTRQMPPWFAEPVSRRLRNAPHLTDSDIHTISAWADSGAREGDVEDKPSEVRQWTDGWRTEPDVVISMESAYAVGATGTGEIKEFFIPSPFKEDTWVSSIEIRPGDPSVVHHVILQMSDWVPPPPTTAVASADGKEINVIATVVADRFSNALGGGYANMFPSGPGPSRRWKRYTRRAHSR